MLFQKETGMELFIFARFHARAGKENAVEQALREVTDPSRKEPGCLSFHVFRSTREPRLFYIHSRWRDEAAFDTHAGLPHTVRFLERVEQLIDHPRDVTRATIVV
jgi:quinol monooxygenase YgiN